MGKKLFTLALVLFTFCSFAQTRPGSFKGKVTDAGTGETLPIANVVLKNSAGDIVAGGTTDFDGKFNINPVTPGSYDVEVSFTGYATVKLSGVDIAPNNPTIQNFKLSEASDVLTTVEIIYEAPLIDGAKTIKTFGKEDIADMAVRDITSIVSQAASVNTDEAGNISIRGARPEGTVFIVDGVKIRGGANLPQGAIQSTEVITGGLPAQYGDAVGGIVNTTTRGPSPTYFGSVELLSSTPLELLSTKAFGDYDYNLGALTLGGPIIKNKESGIPIVGFLLATEFQYVKEGRPGVIPYIHLDEDVLEDLKANPIAIDPSGRSILYRSEFVTNDDLSDIDYQPNSFSNQLRVNGNVQIKTSKTTNLTLGGFFNYSNDKSNSYGSHIFNFENNQSRKDAEWSSYIRFQQQFGTSSEDNKGLIKNAFYTIQMDYTRNTTNIFDDRYEDNFFRYGHVGKFVVNEIPAYVFGEDSASGVSAFRYVGNAPAGVEFEQGPYNTVRGNYVSRYFELAETNPGLSTLTLDNIRGAGIPVNGSNPRSIYSGLWTSPGTALSVNSLGVTGANFFENRQSQFRVTASTSFDIKDHSLIVGFEYEQRTDRAYALDATSLWQRLDQLQNSAIEQLDLERPIFSYDDNGVFQDTITYPRLFTQDDVSEVDRNVRIALGLDPNGTDILNIHELDPSLFSVDMFAPDELINPGGVRFVGYYGYDFAGNVLDRQPTITEFFTERDERGNFTRPVGAFQPIYIAGYIQDQFTFNDLTFNVGVRIDRFDLNQQVLKDPFVLYPVYSVKDIPSTELNVSEDIPASIGSDYVVYLSSFDYQSPSTSIVGYRDPEDNQWYNSAGRPISDPQQLAAAAGGGIKPFLVTPPGEEGDDGDLTGTSFKDYDPQTVVMPRVAFNFPITDEALFIAHYDLLAQRPTTGLSRLDPFDYLDLANKRASGVLNNPNLRPQKTTEYELGFKQTLTDNTALKISAFYRELRDLIQTQAFTQAYPLTYIAYGNLDFGTVKGFSLEYEMRRTNHVKLDANYTLQFADGTGSSANSGVNLANNGQPNLRYILPLSYDNRHQVLVRLDYRYSDRNYDGPVWWNKRVFENAGVNVTMNGVSGRPYTKRDAPFAVTNNNPSSVSQVDGQINGSRLPWQVSFDARVNKVFGISKENKGLTMEVYLQVLNLFNTKNVIGVYAYTGSADDDGFLASPAAQTQIAEQTNSQAYVDLYNRRMLSPFNYTQPRRVRLGVAINF